MSEPDSNQIPDLGYSEQTLPGHLSLIRYRVSARDESQVTLTSQMQPELSQSREMFRYKLFVDPNKVDDSIKPHFANYQLMGLDLWSKEADQRVVETKLKELQNPESKIIPIFFQCGLSSEPDQLDNPSLPLVEALQTKMKAEAANPDSPLYGHEIMLIGFSQPGFGQSVFRKDKSSIEVEDVNDQAAANLYEGIVKSLGIPTDKAKAIWAGHSAGGSALFELLKTHPEWAGRAVLFNPALSPDKSQLDLFKQLLFLEKSSVEANTAQPGDDFFSGSHDGIFIHNGAQIRAAEMIIEQAKRMVSPDPADLTIPADLKLQARMHAKQSRYSRGLLKKLEALANTITPANGQAVKSLGRLPSFFIGKEDRITPYAERWVRQYYESLFALVGESAGLTEAEKAAILEANTAQPGDD